jgi:hypothetical protein
MVLKLIGENFQMSKTIAGCRVVDKLKGIYKFEMWSRLPQEEYAEINEIIFDDIYNKVFSDIAPKAKFRVAVHQEKRIYLSSMNM